MSKWDIKKNGVGYEWSLKKSEQEKVDEYENFARSGEVGQMFLVLAFVVFINSAVSTALFAGIAYTLAIKVNPQVDKIALGDEIQYIMVWAGIWLTVIQCLLIIVHGFIGRTIAKHVQ